MTKFVYEMENLLDIAYQLEDQAKSEFANAMNALLREEDKLERLNTRQEFYQNKLTDLVQSDFDLLEIQKYKAAFENNKINIKEQEKKVFFANQKVEKAREKLRQAMVECKTHEKLKERAKEEYLEEYKLHQQKEIDEITSYRYGNTAKSEEELNVS